MSAPPPRPLWHRLDPRVGVRTQLFLAALFWLCGPCFLLARGVLFLAPGDGSWFAAWSLPIAAAAAVLGILKAHFVLRGYAERAVARIGERGTGCLFGLFSWRSWLLLAAMITAGVAMRSSTLTEAEWGRGLLALIYLTVGVALLLADGVFWKAALRAEAGSA